MYNKIKKELLKARKNKDNDRKNALSLIIGEIQRSPKKDYSDDNIISMLKKLSKLAIESNDEVLKNVIDEFLPTIISEEEIIKFINANIDFSLLRNPMQACGLVKKEFGQSVDMSMVNKIVSGIINK